MSIQLIAADESKPGAHQGKGKSSLIEIAPALYKQAMRYPKFYGDENTTHGNILERSHLFGNAGGVRDSLVDQGIYIDLGVTQFLQGNVSGGDQTTSSVRTNGSVDAWLWLDTGKAGLWSNGAIFIHGETNWVPGINSDVGSILPANQDATDPESVFSRVRAGRPRTAMSLISSTASASVATVCSFRVATTTTGV